MPDHDTFDLDRAFSSLERDIATVSSPRGAAQAVASARRRRRTTYGAVAAVALLAVGAAAIGQGLATRDDSVGPAELPTPAAFDAAALSAATDGWTSDWRTPTKTDQPAFQADSAPQCLQAVEGSTDEQATPDPARTGGGLLVADDEASLGTLAEWGDDHPGASTAGYDAVVTTLDRCAQATAAHDYTWNGARGQSWTVTSGGQPSQHIWIAQTGRAVGVLWAGGSAGPVPDAVDEHVISALVAGLQSPESFPQQVGPSSGSSSGSSAAVATVGDADFAKALGSWTNGWQERGTKSVSGPLPCAGDWASASGDATGASLGGNGEQDSYGFDTSADAAAAAEALAANLHACTSSPATVTQVAITGAAPVTVVVGSGDNARVTWIVQRASTVSYITIPATTTPPDAVSEAVCRLIVDGLAQAQEGSVSAPSPSASAVAPGN
jgi:hypothetical protein